MLKKAGRAFKPAMSVELNIPEVSVTTPTDGPRYKISDSGRLSPHHHFSRKTSASSEHSDSPTRRKSILHNANNANNSPHENHNHHVNLAFSDEEKHWDGESPKEKSIKTISRENSFYSDSRQMHEDTIVNSWWYLFCMKCRHEESTNAWEPPHWQKVCPYPFCPTYRYFARLLALFLVGLLLWGIVYSILGETAGPGGQLFGLSVLCICAKFGGWLVTIFTLPALVGMLMVGILFQNITINGASLIDIEGDYLEVCSVLRKFALVIILIRAGLDLDPAAMRRLYLTVLKLGLIPWIAECVVIAVATNLLLGLPWDWAFMLGSIIAAVSPAVVVPCLFRLRRKGYGVAKGIPTLIIAVSGIDDATSVAIFGIISGLMFSSDLTLAIIQGPLSIIMGIGFGVLWGLLSKFVPEKDDPFAVPLRILMLLGGGLISVFGSDVIGFGGAGPLGCITAAFVSCYFWTKDGWDIEDNPAATAFEIFWMIFEPILFGITGTAIKINEMDADVVTVGVGCLVLGVVIRILVTVVVAIRAKLNLKEKIFVAFSWMAKATVQAALGPVALDRVRNSSNADPKAQSYAEIVLLVCVLSIIVTAPIGAIIITLSGPRLLTKTSAPPPITEWRRRSHRPSIRDISIIDEDDEDDDDDDDEEKKDELENSQKGSAPVSDTESGKKNSVGSLQKSTLGSDIADQRL